MSLGCFVGFDAEIARITLATLSVAIALTFLIAIKKFDVSNRTKLGLIYGHLMFLFFPFILLTTNFACGAMCLACYGNSLSMLVYAVPSTVVIGVIAGIVVIPAFYTLSNKEREIKGSEIKSFTKKYSKKLGIKNPKIYVIDKAKPMAFSFKSVRSAIFVSAGMFDVLSKKEMQAVLLHELAHIKQKSSVMKISWKILNLFSPFSLLARFHHDTGKEERNADEFATRMQKTNRHIVSAKKKIRELKSCET